MAGTKPSRRERWDALLPRGKILVAVMLAVVGVGIFWVVGSNDSASPCSTLASVSHDVTSGKTTNHDAAVRLQSMSIDDQRENVRLAASNLQTAAKTFLISEHDTAQAGERDQLLAQAIRHLNDVCS